MSRPLDITQRQVRALCEGAKQAGCIAVVQIGKSTVSLVPEDRAIQILEKQSEEDVDAERVIPL